MTITWPVAGANPPSSKRASYGGPAGLCAGGQVRRPSAIGRSNWLFAGSLTAVQRAAAVMSLVHSARLNGHNPYAYLRDIL